MFHELRQVAILLAMTTIVTGVAYPFAVTWLGGRLFPYQAQGSIILKNGTVVGSTLIGQRFQSDRYFQGRPSAAGDGYDALRSSGSNLAASDTAFALSVLNQATRLEQAGYVGSLPVELVTNSASGLDPDISLATAQCQTARIASARSLPLPLIEQVIRQHVIRPNFGFIGRERVNVLQLNIALDDLAQKPSDAPAPTGTP